MPKNKGKGGKQHRRGKHETDDKKADLEFKVDGQIYAQVIKPLGDGRFELLCDDGKKRIGHVRGAMQRKIWIVVGNVVLASLRSYQDAKCDILHKYSPEEARTLQAYDELGAITSNLETKNSDIVWESKQSTPDEDEKSEKSEKSEDSKDSEKSEKSDE
jgi:translation initiation factor 1A